MRSLYAGLVLASGAAIADPTPQALVVSLLKPEIISTREEMVVCVRVDNQDPAASVLEALRSIRKDVVRWTECVADIAGSYEKSTKRPAMLVSVLKFRPIAGKRAEVAFRIYRNGRWAIQKTLEVEEEGAAWRIIAIKQHVEA